MKAALALAVSLLALAAVPSPASAAVSRLTIGGVRVSEGDAGTKRAALSVRRAGPVRGTSSLRFATANGTATAGSDYVRRSGRLRFRRGQRRKAIVVTVRGDTVDEANETFVVRLSRARGGRLARPRAVATIVDDDSPLGGSPGGGGGGGGGGGPAGPQVVRFVAFGAQGKGNQGQLDVATAVQAKCAADGCDFVQGLGNNIYDDGASSVNDPQFQSKFEVPYQNVDLPFWMTLGNHDYGGGGSGSDFDKPEHQVAYSQVSAKWKMPARYYTRSHQHVDFMTLDTNAIRWDSGNAAAQKTAVPGWFAASSATWRIAVGLHDYRSNGSHGNAGNYDGLPSSEKLLSGRHFKDFMEAHVCGEADVYFSAHDHNLQWPSTTCNGTELIVSGAGASTTTLGGTNPTHFEDDVLGFVYVVIRDRQLTAEFVDTNADTLFTRTISK